MGGYTISRDIYVLESTKFVIVVFKSWSFDVPAGTINPWIGLLTASRNILLSAAEPSHPVSKKMKFIFLSHTASTFTEILPLRFLYLALSTLGTLTGIYVPSNAPRQPYTNVINMV